MSHSGSPLVARPQVPLPPGSVAVVLGTRPEIVKLAPVVERLGDAAFVIHTGQHFDDGMSEVFLREYGLPEPGLRLAAGGLNRAGQIAHILQGVDAAFDDHAFLAVVVQGDTNSTLAGALAANARGVPLVHVEAGLRSYDRAMPEEHNRVAVDHLADILCAGTPDNVDNLRREGVPDSRIALTGNTVVEAVVRQLPPPSDRLRVVSEHGLHPDGYLLATIHRPENTDVPETLGAILAELSDLPLPVVLPLHPRTRAAARAAGLGSLLDRLRLLEPLGSRTFLSLASHSAALVSDSGGVQEECTVIKRPLVVVRRSTERPEALADFATLVAPGPEIGAAVRAVLADLRRVHGVLQGIPSPFGDAKAADRVVEALLGAIAAPEGSASAPARLAGRTP